jgi:Putative auto-transporter adhesin, head GIN domain
MRLLLPVIALSTLSGCSAAFGDATGDTGPRITRSYDLKGFDGVVLAGSDDVRITQGANFAVSANGPEKQLNDLEILVENGVLKISRKKGAGWSMHWGDGDDGVTVSVTLPILHKATIAGSGDMDVSGTAQDQFTGTIAGSGDLKISNANAATTTLTLAGSGDLAVSGKTKTLSVSLAGSGDVHAGGLSAETASISGAGSGDVRARASQSADVSLVGSGDVTIEGTKNCKISKTGSGDVTCG